MALNDLELSLMAFPQNWDSTQQQLNINLLLLPVGNPLDPLPGDPPGAPPRFAGRTISLNTQFIAGLDSPPTTGSPIALTKSFVATPPPAAVALFNGLLAKLPAGTTVTSDKVTPAKAPADNVFVKKGLPATYTNAFAFDQPRDKRFFFVGDGYGCALTAQSPGVMNDPVTGKKQDPPPKVIAWGQILSFVLRQPALAQAVGLVYPVSLPISAATVKDGGWLFFTLDTSSAANPYVKDFTTNHDSVKSYAARIPPLDKNKDRRIFAATLFPIAGSFDPRLSEAQFEAEIYDDGFAQIVHCSQPPTADSVTADATQIPPGTDAGIQLGWDDEQVTIWLNRQIELLRDRAKAANKAPESPLGLQGYRVDVQQVRPAGDGKWHSLCDVTGSLPFSGSTSDGSGSTPSKELFVAPAPVRSTPPDWVSPNPESALLPLYFAQWRGNSLVVSDDILAQITPPGPDKKPLPSSTLSANLANVPILRFGNDYQFRVRFVDLTGGGPTADKDPVHPGLSPNGFCAFRRYIPPKALEIDATPPPPPPPANPDAVRVITRLDVRKPRIGYPEAIFGGVDPSVFSGASLATLIADAQAARRALSIPDPDVDRFEVLIEARIPNHDGGAQGSLPGQLDGDRYRVVYSIIEHFPDSGDPDPVVSLSLDYQDHGDIATIVAPGDDSPTLLIPTARDIRIRLTPLSAERSSYYGTPQPPRGLVTDYIVRQEASSEADLYPFDPPAQLKGFYFQPGNNLPQLLAQGLGLKADGLTFSIQPGSRISFGAAAGLRHTLAPDASTITFTNQAELLNHWIVALVIDLSRDWTWDGFSEPALTIFRDSLTSPIGTVTFYRTVAASALGGLAQLPNRSTSRIIFFDTINPLPDPGKFPDVLNPIYTVVASFKSAAALNRTYNSLVLPITTPPSQTPRIVSTGIAESPFKASPDYSETFARERHLWVEFDQPILDSADDEFCWRLLGYGPDPILAASLLPPNTVPPTVEPPLAIDPEPVRMIFAGQSPDTAGLDAMNPFIAAIPSSGQPDGVHFILPLPPGISPDELDLFGFWTYEFRVRHKKSSTAQARHGRPLRVSGVQHPVPQLTCTVQRNQDVITVTAPYATTVLNGVRLYDLQRGDPQTTLWTMLYAQVTQTDGAAHRNVLLARHEGQLIRDFESGNFPLSGGAGRTLSLLREHTVNREPRSRTSFNQKEIVALLSLLGLPLNSPLSVLTVEVLPGPFNLKGDFARLAGVAVGAAPANEDPLGRQLGLRRVLRTSPLTPVPAIC